MDRATEMRARSLAKGEGPEKVRGMIASSG